MWSTVESMIPSHPYPFIIAQMTVPRGRVTKLYSIVVVSSMKALPIVSVWERDLGLMSVQPDWEDIWSHLAHQLIHYKRMHGSYTTPYSHFKMNLSSAKTP